MINVSYLKMKARLFTCIPIFALFFQSLQAQESFKQYISPHSVTNSGGYVEFLPSSYATNTTQTYPLILFLHGQGELGNGNSDLSKLVTQPSGSLPVLLTNASSITVNGQPFNFIVISPQFSWGPGVADVQSVLNYALQHYRVDLGRIYVTGLSLGGGVAWQYAAAYPNQIAAMVPISACTYVSSTEAQSIANNNIHVWATHNIDDPTCDYHRTVDWVNSVNGYSPNLAKITLWPTGGHDAWTNTYRPDYKENNLNIYEWMLQFTRTTGNQPPTANAGADQTITLPQNTVTLNGSQSSDPDGTIISYAWSGPAGVTVSSPSSASTTVTGLAQGTYVFQLKVTDNAGATATDNVTVIVNPAPSGVTTRIEAEAYTNMSGVIIDPASGTWVGWIDNGDWMEYSYNAPSTGTYTIRFRVSTPMDNAQLNVKDVAGNILATIAVPKTGAFETFQTVSATINLPGGQQTLRVQSIMPANWNFDWLEIDAAVNGGITTKQNTESLINTKVNFNAFPNPVENRVSFQVENSFTGQMKGELMDMQGHKIRSYNLIKGKPGSEISTIYLGWLPKGQYIFKLSINGWSKTTKLLKL